MRYRAATVNRSYFHRGYYANRYRGYYPNYGGFYPGALLGFGSGYGLPWYGAYSGYGYNYNVPAYATYASANGPMQGTADMAPTEVAFLVVTPPTATVWANGVKTRQTGPEREFSSSGLVPGKSYTYNFRAAWTAPNGQPFDQTRTVKVAGGEKRVVDFFAPPR